jgi:cytoskeletal protein CcmA (bactofilin family)
MSIFRRDSEPSPPPAPAPAASPRSAPPVKPASSQSHDRTQIASGSKVVGEVSGSAELLIDGQIEGKIDLDSRVVVGPQGKVRGEIRARSVQIGGQVQGNVQGLERVEVLSSGRLEGDMAAPQVHIADGAFFTGKVEMGRAAEARGRGPAEPKKDAPRQASEAPRKEPDSLAGASAAAQPPGPPQPGAEAPARGGSSK